MSYKRTSQDRIINKQGEHLLDICKGSNLFILNGRCGNDEDKGKLTFRNISLLDYGIASVDSLIFVKDFETIFFRRPLVITAAIKYQIHKIEK